MLRDIVDYVTVTELPITILTTITAGALYEKPRHASNIQKNKNKWPR